MGQTADLAMIQKMNIDALHKEGKGESHFSVLPLPLPLPLRLTPSPCPSKPSGKR